LYHSFATANAGYDKRAARLVAEKALAFFSPDPEQFYWATA